MSHRPRVAIPCLVLAAALVFGSATASQAAPSGRAPAQGLTAAGWLSALWSAAGLRGSTGRISNDQSRLNSAPGVRSRTQNERFLADLGAGINPDGAPS